MDETTNKTQEILHRNGKCIHVFLIWEMHWYFVPNIKNSRMKKRMKKMLFTSMPLLRIKMNTGFKTVLVTFF